MISRSKFISKKNKNVVLVIETSVKGGSISLFLDGNLVDSYIGDRSLSGSEHLLPKISELLKINEIDKFQIDSVIVSNGPGSFTGIRIGIATALALSKSLKCKCYGVDVLKFAAQKALKSDEFERVIPVVSFGRDRFCWFNFDRQTNEIYKLESKYYVGSFEVFLQQTADLIKNKKNNTIAIAADSSIYSLLSANYKNAPPVNLKLIDLGENLSEMIGAVYFDKKNNLVKPEALYLNEENFINDV